MQFNFNEGLPWFGLAAVILVLYIYIRSRRGGKK